MSGTTDWKEWISSYFSQPGDLWGNPKERQVVKLESVLTIAREGHGLDREAFVSKLLEAVEAREPSTTRPIYLVNLGGCGSHWVSRMMAQSAGLSDAGEVYIPPAQYAELLKRDPETAARIMDAIEVAHGLLYGLAPADMRHARMINSAHGCEKIAFYRALPRSAKVIHLIRDPRDRTMSVSFRKEEFRAYEATGLDDFNYMMSKARRTQSDWHRYVALTDKADVQVRYEQFRKEGARALQDMLAAIGVPVSAEAAAEVSHRNSPEFLRQNGSSRHERGNLDQGGVATSWRDTEPRFQRAMHALMARTIQEQGYALCDCFPGENFDPPHEDTGALMQAVAGLAQEDAVRYEFKAPGAAGRWTAVGSAAIPPGSRLRLRLSSLPLRIPGGDAMRSWITDLCVAGLTKLDDKALARIGPLPRLRGIDIASTAVRTRPDPAQFPTLLRINASGCDVPAEAAGVTKDY